MQKGLFNQALRRCSRRSRWAKNIRWFDRTRSW